MKKYFWIIVGSIFLMGANGNLEKASYLSCGCGCCVEKDPKPIEKCVDTKNGETLESIRKKDLDKKNSKDCELAGCWQGILYKVCR